MHQNGILLKAFSRIDSYYLTLLGSNEMCFLFLMTRFVHLTEQNRHALKITNFLIYLQKIDILSQNLNKIYKGITKKLQLPLQKKKMLFIRRVFYRPNSIFRFVVFKCLKIEKESKNNFCKTQIQKVSCVWIWTSSSRFLRVICIFVFYEPEISFINKKNAFLQYLSK